MPAHERSPRSSRRNVLSAVASGGVAALGVIASNSAATDGTADSIDELLLGTFESSLDGWVADGDLLLSRVARADRPVAVTEGEYALEAVADGGSEPTISRAISGLDLATSPYVVADVAPGRIDGTDAPVAFQFRLYRPLDDLVGSEPVAESDPVTVPQAAPGRIYWDASDVEPALLDLVSRLEIGWYPTDRDPDSSDAPFADGGSVVFDAIRATSSAVPVETARLAATMRDLQFEHGAYVRTEVTETFDGGEAGAFVFADGTSEPYRIETVAAGRVRLTVADIDVDVAGGWS